MARKIEVSLEADTSDFEKGLKSAGGAVESFERDLKSADQASSRFDDGLDKTTAGLENTTGKLRSTNDLVSGLSETMGFALPAQAGMIMGFADIADGLGGLLAPALTKAKAAFMALNTTLLSNPIFLVVAALVALTAAFVIAYKKSETFRAIVHGALDGVKQIAQTVSNAVVKAFNFLGDNLGRVANALIAPYKAAFNAIAWAWNNTIGRLSFSIPGWVPGIGGNGWDVPDIPMLAKGGIVNGPTLAMIGEAGPEAVVPLSGPNAGGIGGAARVEIVLSGDAEMVALMRRSVRTRGGNVQVVLGGG